MLRLLVAGATGQTGGAAFRQAAEDDTIDLVGGLAGSSADDGTIPIFGDISHAPEADVLIDFTTADAAPDLIKEAASRGMAVVSGTTGLSDEQEAVVREAAKSVPIVRSGNFSVGINMLLSLVEQAARSLDGFDIEITETHHRRKIDAPSGTALMLGEAAARGIGSTLHDRGIFGRAGKAGPRKDGEIGISAVRGGGVYGDHTVSFFSENEMIGISHRAMDRGLFAQGALTAAKWVEGKAPGIYSMRDVLGLD